MSNEKQETIADIVAEMRSNEFDGPSFNAYSLVAARTLARGWADRIEAAVNQPVTNCNRLDNASKMREALVKADAAFTRISKSSWFIDANFSETKEVMDAGNAVTSALSAPPRNCDLLSDAQEALTAIHEDRCYVNNPIDERRLTVEWLFAEAKGGDK